MLGWKWQSLNGGNAAGPATLWRTGAAAGATGSLLPVRCVERTARAGKPPVAPRVARGIGVALVGETFETGRTVAAAHAAHNRGSSRGTGQTSFRRHAVQRRPSHRALNCSR